MISFLFSGSLSIFSRSTIWGRAEKARIAALPIPKAITVPELSKEGKTDQTVNAAVQKRLIAAHMGRTTGISGRKTLFVKEDRRVIRSPIATNTESEIRNRVKLFFITACIWRSAAEEDREIKKVRRDRMHIKAPAAPVVKSESFKVFAAFADSEKQ